MDIREAIQQSSEITVVDQERRAQALEYLRPRLSTGEVVALSSSILADLDTDTWISQKARPVTAGGSQLLHEMLSRPCKDPERIRDIQRGYLAVPRGGLPIELRSRDSEDVLLWTFSLPDLRETWPLPLLFPRLPVLRQINHHPAALDALHLYRGHLAPWMSFLYPSSSIIGPYFYIKRTMRIPLKLRSYLGFVMKALKMLAAPTGNAQANLSKYVSLCAYIAVFIYSIVQSFEIAAAIRRTRAQLQKRRDEIMRIIRALREVRVDWSHLSAFGAPASLPDLRLPRGMSGIYALWTSQKIRAKLAEYARALYALDAAYVGRRLLATRQWCLAWPHDGDTKMWHMGHPLLSGDQKRNPVDLSRSMILTGPNAAGKTTYMKAIAANVIFAHALGICCAARADVRLVDLLGSFVRVSDEVGSASLFEAEAHRAADLTQSAKAISDAGGSAVYFLDEPMNSTPPVEGAALAISVAEFLGNLPGICVILTTHFHEASVLPTDAPDRFINVSMSAREAASGSFEFPYKLRAGPSTQCIALELLPSHALPPEIVTSAIKRRDKICKHQ